MSGKITKSPSRVVSLLGISHHSAPLDVLERLALSDEEIDGLYRRVATHDGLTDALVISTCNRTELYALSRDRTDTSRPWHDALRAIIGPRRLPAPQHLVKMSGRDSVEHLFRVACGLESMVLGETQILGQIKDAFEVSRAHRNPSPYFDRMVRTAFKVARRSRSATEIGRGAVSIPSAAVHLASRIYSDLSNRTVVVIGAGSTARIAAEHFAGHNPGNLIVVNRTLARAQDIATSVGGHAMPLDALGEAATRADILTSAVRTAEPFISFELIRKVMRARTGRPLAIVDMGLPRNVAPEINGLGNVFLHDLEALKHVADANLVKRRQEVPKVEALIKGEVKGLHVWERTTAAGPLIAALRGAVEDIRQNEVEKASANLSDQEREAVDRATRAVVNKLMHGPMTSIKEEVGKPQDGAERLELIRSIFGNLPLPENGEEPAKPA